MKAGEPSVVLPPSLKLRRPTETLAKVGAKEGSGFGEFRRTPRSLLRGASFRPSDVRQQRGDLDETAHTAGQFQNTRHERVGPFWRLRRSRNIFIGPHVTDFRNLVDQHSDLLDSLLNHHGIPR